MVVSGPEGAAKAAADLADRLLDRLKVGPQGLLSRVWAACVVDLLWLCSARCPCCCTAVNLSPDPPASCLQSPAARASHRALLAPLKVRGRLTLHPVACLLSIRPCSRPATRIHVWQFVHHALIRSAI